MSFIKYPLPESVLQATEQRIQWVMDNFSRICVSFPGKRLHRYAAFNRPGGAVTGEKNLRVVY